MPTTFKFKTTRIMKMDKYEEDLKIIKTIVESHIKSIFYECGEALDFNSTNIMGIELFTQDIIDEIDKQLGR